MLPTEEYGLNEKPSTRMLCEADYFAKRYSLQEPVVSGAGEGILNLHSRPRMSVYNQETRCKRYLLDFELGL